MCEMANSNMQSAADYLAQILQDKQKLEYFPDVFIHVERLLDEEAQKVRYSLFKINGMMIEPLVLPEAEGPKTTLTEKVYIPVKEHPNYNFVGRLIGPRGVTAKQIQLVTGCKMMVRGKGSMRNKLVEEQNRGKPCWEHLDEELHVLIIAEDTVNRAKIKLQTAMEEVKKLLVPAEMDDLKKSQMVELAIINGNYKDSSAKAVADVVNDNDSGRLPLVTEAVDIQGHLVGSHGSDETILGMNPPIMPHPALLGTPPILPQPVPVHTSPAAMLSGSPLFYSPPPSFLLSAADLTSQLWAEYEFADTANHSAGGADKQWRHLGQYREHPYQRT